MWFISKPPTVPAGWTSGGGNQNMEIFKFGVEDWMKKSPVYRYLMLDRIKVNSRGWGTGIWIRGREGAPGAKHSPVRASQLFFCVCWEGQLDFHDLCGAILAQDILQRKGAWPWHEKLSSGNSAAHGHTPHTQALVMVLSNPGSAIQQIPFFQGFHSL